MLFRRYLTDSQNLTSLGHTDRVWHVSWSPTGNNFATCGGDKTIKIWGKDKGKWECKTTLQGTHQRTVRRVAWSPDSKYLAAASFDSSTTVWERQDGGKK
jgi:WD40 repeat protein